MPKIVQLHINGVQHRIEADPQSSLLNVLREALNLTGSKYACGEGQCGACMVLVDGEPTPACICAVELVAGKQVMTIEGLEKNGRLHPLQEAFLEVGALQCGYCTPGMIMSAVALLEIYPHPDTNQIIQFMERNICRCGTYPRIIAAIQRAAEMLKGGVQ